MRPADRGVHSSPLREGVHDVVRELSRGDRASAPSRNRSPRMIRLTLKEAPSVPLEAEALSPDTMAALTIEEIRALPLHLGQRHRRVDEFFEVEGAPGAELEIRGDAQRVKWIGRGMTGGTLRIHGNAGM